MRILYYSDVHCEIREIQTRTSWTDPVVYPLDLGPALPEDLTGTLDLCVLAGDIANIRERRDVSTLAYASQVHQRLMCPVVVVPGNHEYYGGSFVEDRAEFLAAKAPGVHPLDRTEVVLPLHDGTMLRVLGATLWTDFAVTGNPFMAMIRVLDPAFGIKDYQAITWSDADPVRRRFMPRHALAEHRLSRDWLLEKLGEPHAGPTIIVTHHVPHIRAANPRYPIDDGKAAAFYSNCDDVIMAACEAGVVAWVCGHDHWSDVVEINGLKIVKAQFGYGQTERTGWAGPGLLEI